MLNKSEATEVTAESLLAERIIGKINDGTSWKDLTSGVSFPWISYGIPSAQARSACFEQAFDDTYNYASDASCGGYSEAYLR